MGQVPILAHLRVDALNIKKASATYVRGPRSLLGVPHQSRSLVSLRPECKHELAATSQPCPGCGLTFKIKKTMYWHPLVPSAAYIYTRN